MGLVYLVNGLKPRIFALIPARSGSKGIINKNLALVNNFPLIYYSIKFALNDPSIENTFVTTDSSEIADVANSYGAKAPFLRPANISGDLSRDDEFIHHFVDFLSFSDDMCDYIALLRPTSPYRPQDLINNAIQLAVEHNASCVRAMTTPPFNPFKCWYLSQNDIPVVSPVSYLPNEPYNSARQELPLYFWQTGHIDLISVSDFIRTGSITGDRVVCLPVDYHYAIDIDTEDDLSKAEHFLTVCD